MPRKGSKTVTISEEKHLQLKRIAEKKNQTMQNLIENLIDQIVVEVPASG